MQGKKESEIEKGFPEDSPLRKLIKMFRTNTVVKHHIQGAGSSKPQGVAKAFFSNALSFQNGIIPGHTAYDRYARYSDYAEMLSYPILNRALSTFAEESTQKDEKGKIITVTSDNKQVQDKIQDLFDNVLQLNGKKIYKIVRDLCKYGDYFALIDITTEHGVVNLIHMPAGEVEREEGYDKNEPTAVRFKWNNQNTTKEIPNAFVAHFRLDGDDLFYPYGQSALEAARRPWRQLVLLEDAMMVYRITRSAERRAFYVDMMGIPPENVEEAINKINQELKKKRVVNDQGKIDLRYGATLDVSEDLIIPVRGQESATRIETLPGGQNIGDIEDIEFIKKNLFAALGIPKAFLTFDEGVGAKATLTTEDIRFARTISKIQECVMNELVKIALIHLYMNGVRGKDLVDFKIKMTNPSTVAEMQKNELWRARLDLVMTAGQGVFDTTFIYKEFLNLSNDAIDMIRKGQIQDKIFQAKLMAIETSGGAMMPGGMGGGMDMMGGMGGMGGGMGMGGMGASPLDLGQGAGGGAMPNVMGSPSVPMESFNPAAQVTGNGKVTHKDLTRRNSNERIGELRELPVDELPNQDIEDILDAGLDTDGLQRAITSPMGTNESVKNKKDILKETREVLNEYRLLAEVRDLISTNVNGYLQFDAKTYPSKELISFLSEKFEFSSSGVLTEAEEASNSNLEVLDEEYQRLQKNIEKIA